MIKFIKLIFQYHTCACANYHQNSARRMKVNINTRIPQSMPCIECCQTASVLVHNWLFWSTETSYLLFCGWISFQKVLKKHHPICNVLFLCPLYPPLPSVQISSKTEMNNKNCFGSIRAITSKKQKSIQVNDKVALHISASNQTNTQ